jgi:N-methylhydantoinase A
VSIRSAISGVMKKPKLEKIPVGKSKPRVASQSGKRQVFFGDSGWCLTPIYRRDSLLAHNCIRGPALIEEHASTTVVHPGDLLTVDEYGNLHLKISYEKS